MVGSWVFCLRKKKKRDREGGVRVVSIVFRVFSFFFCFLLFYFLKCKIIGCWVMDRVDPV